MSAVAHAFVSEFKPDILLTGLLNKEAIFRVAYIFAIVRICWVGYSIPGVTR